MPEETVMEALDPENWSYDVTTALHDDLKHGIAVCPTRSVRIVISRKQIPSSAYAADLAACMAVATNGGIPIDVRARY